MACIEVIGGIAAEIKSETSDAVEIKLWDILQNESDGEDDPFSVEHDESSYTNQPKKCKNKILGNVNLPESDLSNNLEEQILTDGKDKENVLVTKNGKNNNDKSSKELRTEANTQTKEKLILNYTANEDLLKNNKDVELESNEDLLENNKEVELEANKDLLEKNKELEVEKKQQKTKTQQLNMPVDSSKIYRINEGILCINKDTSKVATVPTSSVLCTEYTVEDLNKFHCNHCQYVTKVKRYLNRHIRNVHRNNKAIKTYKCRYCPFKSKYGLTSHIISMHKVSCTEYTVDDLNKFHCNNCQYVTKHKGHLNRHIRDGHGNNKAIKTYKFRSGPLGSKYGLKSPIISMHKVSCTEYTVEDLNKFQCNHCQYVTKVKGNLNRHIRNIHRNNKAIKTYQCPYCPFKSKYGLKSHFTSMHKVSCTEYTVEDLNKFHCNHCQFVTKVKGNLNRHIRNVHRNNPPSTISCTEYTVEDLNKFHCNHCQYVTKHKGHLTRHIRDEHGNNKAIKTYKCRYCPFKSKYGLKSHIISMHKVSCTEYTVDDLNKFHCNNCQYVTKQKGHLNRHIRDGHGNNKAIKTYKCRSGPLGSKYGLKSSIISMHNVSCTEYTLEDLNKFHCNHCQYVTKHKGHLNRHIRDRHGNNKAIKTYKCWYCPFESKHGLQSHTMSMHNVSCTEYTVEDFNKFRCNLCQFVTTQKKYVAKHIRMRHRNARKKYECPYCPFKAKYDLNKHITALHKSVNEIELFRCHQCDYKCKLKVKLISHMRTHLDPSQIIDYLKKCHLCPKMFSNRANLQYHIQYFHKKDKVKKLKCIDCEYECRLAAQLRNHRNAYHSNLGNMEILKCLKCSYETQYKHRLKMHLNKTHKDNQFQCEKCAYQTNNLGKIKLHLISHKKIKDDADLKYRCDKCDYKTYRQYSLNIHKLNHLKPEEIQYFYCYHCNFKAKRKDNLKTHVLRHYKHNEVTNQCYVCDFSTTKKHLLISHIDKHSKGLIDVKKQKTKVNKPENMVKAKTRVSERIKQQKKEK